MRAGGTDCLDIFNAVRLRPGTFPCPPSSVFRVAEDCFLNFVAVAGSRYPQQARSPEYRNASRLRDRLLFSLFCLYYDEA